ncbi:MAG: CxxxxCH/CxxCH domain-containing protein [Geobacter sp.]|nr:CxxxxCH/CxxCH domain-containing protein [Geobacter sp.]
MKLLPAVIFAALFAITSIPVEAVAALQCNDCHGTSGPTDYRPLDSATRNVNTGGFQGNHRTHLGAGAAVSSCTICHGNGVNVSTYPSNHRNGRIEMVSNVNNSPKAGGALYSKGIFFNQTSVPVLGTCSNVNCHFEATTPVWGNTAFTSPNDCNKCHGMPPSGGASGAAGSHAKHDLYYAGATNCQKCHSNNTTFAHATSAGKRNLIISFAAAPNNGSGSYSGPLNDYLPSQTNVFGNCSNLYCHSNGKKALGNFSTNAVATWGSSLTCKGCHKSDNASGDTMATGSHAKHVNAANLNTIACAKCHAATANNSMTIIDPASHVNAKVNIKFNSLTTAVNGTYGGQATPYAKDPGTAFGQCNNVYCHSTVQSGATGTGAPVYKTPTWGNAGTGACGSCHEGDNGHSFGSIMSTGSHTKHLALSFGGTSDVMKCAICHNIGGKTLTSGASCDATFCHSAANTTHANGKIDIIINPFYGTGTYNGSQLPRAGFNTCSNVSCHYNTTTPVWGTATPINCFGCHSLAVLMASGSHAKHISNSLTPTMYNYTANRSTAGEYNFGCSNCHPVAISNHMNGAVNVTLKKDEAGVGSLRSKNSATGIGIGFVNSGITGTTKTNVVCSAAYCHSNGNAAALVYATTPNWYGGTFTGDRCANCHGNAPNSSIAGSKSHYNTKFLGYTSTAGGHQIGIHAMKIYSSPSGLASAGTTGKSSHGNSGTSTTISCNVCHYATVTTARNDSNPVCLTCHVSGNSVGAQFGNLATIADKSMHVNGSVNIAFQPVSIKSKAQMRTVSFNLLPYSSAWKRNVGYKVSGAYDSAKNPLDTASMWNSSTKTCSNVACHNGQSVKWSDNDGTTNCISCHTTL